ncbi:MAG: histidine kinase, partial [Leptospiraceae bacterium]|nr:histidine kinase [Leptospiraceae bacterium]
MLFRVILISFLFLLNLPLISDDCSTALNFRDKPLSLKGGWLFLRGDNQGWKDPNLQDAGWGRKSLPDYGKDKNSPIYGFHWYRCHIFFSDNSNIPGGLGVYLGKLRDADEVYFNGTLIGSTGKVTPPQSIDFEKKRIYSIPDRLVVPGKNVLAIRIFSTTKNFGITTSPFIGEEEKLYDKIIKEESFPIVAGFVFILMGIFFIFSSLVKSKNHSNLLFSLFSIFLGVYT